jgi:hypothetical protein
MMSQGSFRTGQSAKAGGSVTILRGFGAAREDGARRRAERSRSGLLDVGEREREREIDREREGEATRHDDP